MSTVEGGGNIITDGLVLLLDAANSKSYPGTGTTWTDLSRSGNNGTLINGPTFNSGNGGSIVFDGVNDFVSFSTITNNIYTIDFWYKMGGNDGTYGYFCSSGTNGLAVSEGGTAIGLSFGKLYYHYNGTNTLLENIPSTTDWNHICLVANTLAATNKLQLFGNGVLLGTRNITMSTSITNIGRYITNNTHYLKGNLASYKIYNRALSASEISQNFNSTRARFGI